MEDQKQFNITERLSVRQYVCMREKVPKKNCNLSHSILYQHFTFLFSFSSFKSSCNNSATFTSGDEHVDAYARF